MDTGHSGQTIKLLTSQIISPNSKYTKVSDQVKLKLTINLGKTG